MTANLYGVERQGLRVYYDGDYVEMDDFDPSAGDCTSNPCPINPYGSGRFYGSFSYSGLYCGGAESFVSIAAKLVDEGSTEKAIQFCKDYYDFHDGAWCADFVSACANAAGLVKEGVISPSADTSALARGTVSSCGAKYLKGPAQTNNPASPQRGDLVFFTWKNYNGEGGQYGASHVEIVESFSGGSNPKLVTVGGNSLGRDTYTKDGGDYSNIKYVHHYIRPKWPVSNYSELGPTISANRYLTEDEQKTNAWHVRQFFHRQGWTDQSIAGMLGNFESESTINPGIWEGLSKNINRGFGIAQFTPSTTFTVDFFESNGYGKSDDDSAIGQMDPQLAFILYQSTEDYTNKSGDRFSDLGTYTTFGPPPSGSSKVQYQKSELTADKLAVDFLLGYERPADQGESVKQKRGSQAIKWYNYIVEQRSSSDDKSEEEEK